MNELFFSSPIGRLLFLGRTMIVLLITHAISVLHALFIKEMVESIASEFKAPPPVPLWFIEGLVIFMAATAIIYEVGFVAMPRFRSIGINKWFALCLIIPVFYLRLALALFLLLWPPIAFTKKSEQI
jgi:uncharacterized membrane protein YhaH (DUF805 family)